MCNIGENLIKKYNTVYTQEILYIYADLIKPFS